MPTVANGSIAPLAPDPSAALRTIRVLRDEQFDVLHIHEPLTPGASITALVMRTAPIVATFHAAGESLSYKYLSAPLKGFASAIDHRVAVSKDAVLLAQRYLGGDYQILPNGVELDRFDSSQRVIKKTGTRRSIFFVGDTNLVKVWKSFSKRTHLYPKTLISGLPLMGPRPSD